MSSRRQRSIPLGGRYRQVSLYLRAATLALSVPLCCMEPTIWKNGLICYCQLRSFVSEAVIYSRNEYIPQILWDVITCPCPWYLFRSHNTPRLSVVGKKQKAMQVRDFRDTPHTLVYMYKHIQWTPYPLTHQTSLFRYKNRVVCWFDYGNPQTYTLVHLRC